jgi:hypothetical protein
MNSDFSDLLRNFEEFEVEYLIVGGYAFMYHAEPRYTKDLDVWVRADARNASRVYGALSAFGAPMDQVSEVDFATPGMVFQIGMPPVRVDVLMSLKGVDFELAWQKRIRASLGSNKGWILSREHLF